MLAEIVLLTRAVSLKMNTERAEMKGHTYFQWIYALLANGTLIVYGMECGWISPFSSLLQSNYSPAGYPLSDYQLSWLASTTSVTAMVAGIMYSYIADRFGRKVGIIIIALLEAISWIIRIFNSSFVILLIARIIAALGAAGCFTIIPMYMREICQEDLIGKLGTLPMVMNSFGTFLMYLMGVYLKYDTVNIVTTVVPVVTMIAMINAPESPAFLVKRDDIDKAQKTVALLRGLDKNDDVVTKIVDDLIKEEVRFKSLPTITLQNILKNKLWRHGFILILILFTCFEMNGALVVLTFATKMITSTGIEFDVNPEVQTLSIPIVMLMASVLLTSCVERCGRKPLLIGAFAVTALCMFGMMVIIIVQRQYGNVPAWLPVCALMLAVAMFSGGVSPLSLIVLTEMFNFQIRATMITVIFTYAWLLLFIAQNTYTLMATTLGQFAPFALYGFFNFAGAIFVMFFLTETKGKTEYEIYRDIRGERELDNA